MSETVKNDEFAVIGLHLVKTPSFWTPQESRFLNAVLSKALHGRNLIPSQKEHAVTDAACRGEYIALIYVTNLPLALDVVSSELTALDLHASAHIAWFCPRELVWRDVRPNPSPIRFETRLDALAEWRKIIERDSEAIKLLIALLAGPGNPPEGSK